VSATAPLCLDVRRFHERGEEPFSAIMESVESLAPGQAFLLINSFDPVPLLRVMEKRGFDARSTNVGKDEWHVLFTPR
jgi:uncharacterized protein (DUF2249 family)